MPTAASYRVGNRYTTLTKEVGIDGNISTCTQSINSNPDQGYFRVKFDEEFFIQRVDMYQIFYLAWPGSKDWHYGDCWADVQNYEARIIIIVIT